jgi:hypothetical protein
VGSVFGDYALHGCGVTMMSFAMPSYVSGFEPEPRVLPS